MDTDMFDLFGDEPLAQSTEADKVADGAFEDGPDDFDISKLPTTDDYTWSFRLDDASRSPCCQRLAWSKTGVISAISDDQQTISFRTVSQDRKTKLWILTDELHDPIQAPPDIRFVHLDWSGLGIDLLALDQYGNNHIYTLLHALNRLQPQTIIYAQPVIKPTAIVGIHWLPIHPQQFPVQHLGPLTWEDDEWYTGSSNVSMRWPHHPVPGKAAFLAVTQSQLQLVYQQEAPNWLSTTISLANVSEDILTHSAFANADGFIYMVTFSNNDRLRLYRVTIDWTSDGSAKPAQPSLSVLALQVINRSLPQFQESQSKLSSSPLSHISILPSTITTLTDTTTFQIIAVFDNVRNPNDLPPTFTGHSTVIRWEIQSTQDEVLDIFSTLQSNGTKPNSLETMTALARLKDCKTRRLVSALHRVHSEDIIAFMQRDGSIEYLDSEGLDKAFTLSGLNDQCSSWLLEAGFRYPTADPDADCVLAPNGCMTANITDKGKVSLRPMINFFLANEENVELGWRRRAIASVAREAAKLMYAQVSFDEIFMLLPEKMLADDRRYLIKQIYRTLRRPLDFCEEDPRKYMNNFLRDHLSTKALAAQLTYGYRDLDGQPDPSGKLAHIAMNLKATTVVLAQTVSLKDSRAASFISLRYCARWVIDLLIMAADDLITTFHWRKKHLSSFELDTVNQRTHDTGSISLLMVMSATTRHLIRMILDLIKPYFIKLKDLTPQTPSEQIHLLDLQSYSKAIPLQIPLLEFLLIDIDKRVRAIYTLNMTSQQRVEAELAMLIDGNIPTCLAQVADYLTDEAAGKILEAHDISRISFCDVEWLGLRDGDAESGWNQWRKYDVVRKSLIRRGMRLRTCRRCGCVMEDIDLTAGAKERGWVAPWLVQAQRSCVCGGLWILEKP